LADNFLKIRHLEGELKFYHKNNGLGITLSTRELVLQRPHINYRFKLEHIISMVPFEKKGKPTMSLIKEKTAYHEITIVRAWGTGEQQQYKLDVSQAEIHSRSGILQTGRLQFIVPIHPRLLEAIVQYGQLSGIE
jgi:hypothetical protein